MSALTLETYNGKIYAVCVTDDEGRDRTIAAFKYGDQAEKWAREAYGEWDGWRFRMPAGVRIEVVDAPDGVALGVKP